MKGPFLLGRLVFGGYFLHAGIHHFQERKMLTGYAAQKKVPMPDRAVELSGAMLIVGGTSILLGLKPKLGTAAIIGFLAPVSFMMHDFWNIKAEERRMNEMINFTKNIALLGGALALMGVEEPWPASVPIGQPGRLERARRFVKYPRS